MRLEREVRSSLELVDLLVRKTMAAHFDDRRPHRARAKDDGNSERDSRSTLPHPPKVTHRPAIRERQARKKSLGSILR
jgi:hypothetical protein